MDVDNIGIPKINWLASYPKSGNTWVRSLLFAYTYGHVNINDIGTLVGSDLNLGAWFAASPYPWNAMNDAEKLLCRYTALMIMTSTSIHRNNFILKTHCGNYRVEGVDLIPTILTKGAVYIVRDPRDVAISYAKHTGKSIDDMINNMGIANLCLETENTGVSQIAGSWSNNVKSWTSKTSFEKIIVKYEDLLLNGADTLRSILTILFPGKEIDEKRLEHALNICSFENLKKQEETSKFIEGTKHSKFFTVGRSSWEETLTKEQISRIEDDHHEVMDMLGYKLYT